MSFNFILTSSETRIPDAYKISKISLSLSPIEVLISGTLNISSKSL